MPKVGMEPMRRSALVEATISEIGRKGSLDVTVSQIAKSAGMSSALAHHYFGSKDQILIAAMQHLLSVFGNEVRNGLLHATTSRERLNAIIAASFSAQNFQPHVISAWLNFYVKAQTSTDARRLLDIYHKRLHSNLVHDLRPLVGNKAAPIAQSVAAMIDGLYLRQALQARAVSSNEIMNAAMLHLDNAIENANGR